MSDVVSSSSSLSWSLGDQESMSETGEGRAELGLSGIMVEGSDELGKGENVFVVASVLVVDEDENAVLLLLSLTISFLL